MENAGYLLAAFIIIWAVCFVYILFMQRRQRKLEKEIQVLQKSMTAESD